MPSNLLWVMAPEHAPAVFESYRRQMLPDEKLPEIGVSEKTVDDYAALITRKCGSIAVISIHGAIDRQTLVGWWSGGIFAIGQDAIRAAIASALGDNSIRAILLSINSPGGVVAGTKELADFISAANKPVAAYVDGLAASGAFWLASATGRIFAPATGQVGSIGVIMTVADYSAFYQKIGVRLEHIASGKYKAAGRGERPLEDEEREYFQSQLARLHAVFRADVATNLKITANEADWAEAQILIGEQARSLGLVSEIVRDEAAAIEILQEENMEKKITLELLAAEAPDLLAQIRADAVKDSEAGQAARIEQATKDGTVFAVAAIKAVCSESDAKAVEEMLVKAEALKLTPEQLAGMADLFHRAEAPASASQNEILAALQKAHAPAVNAGNPKPQGSILVADAERRAK